MPYTTTYPTDPYVLNPQDETNDFIGPGDDAIANAVDYARHDQEIGAIHDDLLAALVAAGDPADIAAMVTALVGGFTDGRIWIGGRSWTGTQGQPGVWGPENGAAGPHLRRAGGDGSSDISAELGSLTRTKANMGLLVQKIDYVYEVKTAGVTNDVKPEMHTRTVPSDGNPPGFAGAAGGNFDTGHNTAAKRRTIGNHTATFTPSGQIFILSTADQVFTLNVDDAGGGTAIVDFYGCYVYLTAKYIEGV